MILTASVEGVSPESVEGNSDGKAVGNSPEVAAARAALERQWRESNNPASPPEIVAEAASASSQAWSLGSVGAIFGSVVKVAAQAITFSRQAIVKGLACIGISFDQAANTHASDAANDSDAANPWEQVAQNTDQALIHNAIVAEIIQRGH
jgi:hypothetical protein